MAEAGGKQKMTFFRWLQVIFCQEQHHMGSCKEFQNDSSIGGRRALFLLYY